MNYTNKQREYYNLHRDQACKALGLTKFQYNKFRMVSHKVNNLDCQSCNGEITEQEYDKAMDSIYTEVNNLFTKYNQTLFIYHQSDPRGASLYLNTKVITYDNYPQAWCIY